jgi:predicted nucleic acid-binding Zn ribbon protein
MSIPSRRGPQPLADALGTLFSSRGYGQLRALGELEAAWMAAVGEPACRQTRVGGIRHGVLSITVAHSALLEELAAFRKHDLLAALQCNVPSARIHDIRFRVGSVSQEPLPPDGESQTARGKKGQRRGQDK